jgi:hypothetical protein
MKKLISFTSAALLTASFLDAFYSWGVGRPVPWLRDTLMAAAGAVCYYLLVSNRLRL